MRSLKKVLRDLRSAQELADAAGTLGRLMVEYGTESNVEAASVDRLTARLAADLQRVRKRIKKMVKAEAAAQP
jgi:hypothetical protein